VTERWNKLKFTHADRAPTIGVELAPLSFKCKHDSATRTKNDGVTAAAAECNASPARNRCPRITEQSNASGASIRERQSVEEAFL
jgi:hypothetical protein